MIYSQALWLFSIGASLKAVDVPCISVAAVAWRIVIASAAAQSGTAGISD